MPELRVQVDATAVVGFLGALSRQMPFAISVALNRTGDDGNAALRAAIPQHFHVRDKRVPAFVAPLFIPKPNRATKTNLAVLLDTEGKGLLLAPFEEGVPKVAGSPDQPIAVPTTALRTTPTTAIARRMYPKNLGLTARKDASGLLYFSLGKGSLGRRLSPKRVTRRGAVQVKGKLRTFILDPRYARNIRLGQWGIYQRFGPGKHDIRMLWHLTEEVHRPRVLFFLETVDRTTAERWTPNMLGAFEYAVATAK